MCFDYGPFLFRLNPSVSLAKRYLVPDIAVANCREKLL